MNKTLWLTCMLACSAACTFAQSAPAAAPAQPLNPDAAWEPLFDGKSLDGWTRRGGKAVYTVEGHAIVGTTAPDTPNSFLCTDRFFSDFDLEYEFKVDPKLNSGVQIRSNSFPAYQDGRVHGYQVEIDPSERAYTAGIYDEARQGWLAPLDQNEAARKAFRQDEWNKVRVLAIGDSIRTWLNGVPAADLHDDLTPLGFIGLQVHSSDEASPLSVRWRNLRIRDFSRRARPAGALVLVGEKPDLSEWVSARDPQQPAGWTLADGYVEVAPGTGDIQTRRTFRDYDLHVEFAVDDNGKDGQANGNSGVYSQGRYEVQVLNCYGRGPALNECGAIYNIAAPRWNCAAPPGVWQTYDIRFRAPRWNDAGEKQSNARLTVRHNGVLIHDDLEVPTSTGAGRPEAAADGPVLLQDHGNRIRYRNIWIVPD